MPKIMPGALTETNRFGTYPGALQYKHLPHHNQSATTCTLTGTSYDKMPKAAHRADGLEGHGHACTMSI